MLTINNQKNYNANTTPKNKTLEGVLVNNHINIKDAPEWNFDEISDSLLIRKSENIEKNTENKNSFDVKKALTPLFIGTSALFLGFLGLSSVLSKSAKNLSKTANYNKLPDLAINMNIKQETHFATYRMLRDPSFKNIIGAGAVFLFSILTLVAKNFIDGVKNIWIKKQEADIERDFQEDLISVETKVFKGKLDEVNRLLDVNVNYFKNEIRDKNQKSNEVFFSKYFNFKGNIEKDEDKDKKDLKENIKYLLMATGSVALAIITGKFTFNNIRKSLKSANEFTNNYTQNVIETIKKVTIENSENNLDSIINMFKIIGAKPTFIKETLNKMGIKDEDKIKNIIDDVEYSTKSMFTDAPTALGGVPQKIQYYCYLDEDRGHLYNWVLNPDNKFTKYIFLSFATVSAVSYLIKEGFDALKSVAVTKENTKTELNLKKRLADVEIENFKTKKNVAITPLVENFNQKLKNGTSSSELKKYAETILCEIKNGPPYIYS